MDYTNLLNLTDPKQTALLITITLWELIWKGFGMWRAGRRNQPIWFILILILNTFGILPIVYLILTKQKKIKLSKKKKK